MMGSFIVTALRAAEAALAEGLENCGGDPDCIWFEPLQLVRDAMREAGIDAGSNQ